MIAELRGQRNGQRSGETAFRMSIFFLYHRHMRASAKRRLMGVLLISRNRIRRIALCHLRQNDHAEVRKHLVGIIHRAK